MTTKSVGCTRSTKTTIVMTAAGPEERTEVVMEGGPECQSMADKSEMGALFPTFQGGGTKGSILVDTKTVFGNPFGDSGFDLGGFKRDVVEDDVPDFRARSVKSTRLARKADFVGKGTETSDLD